MTQEHTWQMSTRYHHWLLWLSAAVMHSFVVRVNSWGRAAELQQPELISTADWHLTFWTVIPAIPVDITIQKLNRLQRRPQHSKHKHTWLFIPFHTPITTPMNSCMLALCVSVSHAPHLDRTFMASLEMTAPLYPSRTEQSYIWRGLHTLVLAYYR